MKKSVYSMCGMCSVRCPIRVEVEDGRATWIEGNPHILGQALCGKGSAGLAFHYREERPRGPMIRQGMRGGGQWKRVTWDTVLDYTAEKLNRIMDKHGGRSVFLSCRGGPFLDLPKTFLKALGSPNFTNHDASCGRNVHHASLSLYGLGRKAFLYDLKNCRHLVLNGRNMLEALKVKEAKDLMAAVSSGMRLTYIDVRQTVTGSKASRFWMVRPGTDYALHLAIIHEVIRQGAYDKDFIDKWVSGFEQLMRFVEPYTPQWAEKRTGVPAGEIADFVKELDEDRPRVVFHPGWMLARYMDSFYVSRTSHILNILMGSVEVAGGQIIAKGPGDYGKPGLNALADQVPKPTEKRADGVGWKFPHFDPGPGLFQLFYSAILSEDPYPIKAYIAYRHDPLTGFPDREAQRAGLDKLDLIVALDAKFGETTWYGDVILPLAGYLEKDSIVIAQKGKIPRLTLRRKAIEPVYDSRPEWWIFKELAGRMGLGQYFPYQTVEELWNYQLAGTGYSITDFEEKGFVDLAEEAVFQDREAGLKFKTPSGKIELISPSLEQVGHPSLAEYKEKEVLPDGHFRLVFGRHAIHAHGHTQNNPLLHEIFPANTLWINDRAARVMGVEDNDLVEVAAKGVRARVRALVTPFIHPEAVFTVHGFGRTVPVLKRAFGAGFADQRMAKGCLELYDPAGGGVAYQEALVTVRKVDADEEKAA
ncbi:MAG: molybdopterin-dependent oxidoreductase [Deltaproteobacteria bacterium]|nr:molybdopterin-dependent oxidoreductase [Deltaproteobacteria bacterium]